MVKEHLISRGMNPNLYRVQYGEGTATFFLYNLLGQIVGYQQYRTNTNNKKVKNNPKEGKYFTYVPHKPKHHTTDAKPLNTSSIFGLEVDNGGPVYVVEGIFKAATLHRLGFTSWAVLTSSPKQLKNLFFITGQARPVIGIGDADSAGKKLVNILGRGFQTRLDLDELPDSEIMELLK